MTALAVLSHLLLLCFIDGCGANREVERGPRQRRTAWRKSLFPNDGDGLEASLTQRVESLVVDSNADISAYGAPGDLHAQNPQIHDFAQQEADGNTDDSSEDKGTTEGVSMQGNANAYTDEENQWKGAQETDSETDLETSTSSMEPINAPTSSEDFSTTATQSTTAPGTSSANAQELTSGTCWVESCSERCNDLPFKEMREVEAKVKEMQAKQTQEVVNATRDREGEGCTHEKQSVKDEWLQLLFRILSNGTQYITHQMWNSSVWDPSPKLLWSVLDKGRIGAITEDDMLREWQSVTEALMERQKHVHLSDTGQYLLQVAAFEVILYNALKGAKNTLVKHATITGKSGIPFVRLGKFPMARGKFVHSEPGDHECTEKVYYDSLYGLEGMRQTSMHQYLVKIAGAYCRDLEDKTHKLSTRSQQMMGSAFSIFGVGGGTARAAPTSPWLLLGALSALILGAPRQP